MAIEQYFIERLHCPFCYKSSNEILTTVNYHDTAEANRRLPNIEGKLYLCMDCGIAYPSHMYTVEGFSEIYKKTLNDWSFLDATYLQTLRKKYLKAILRNYYRSCSISRLLDALSLHVFQVPIINHKPSGLRIIDVGCGFGEFLSIYHELGNKMVGTEIIATLVDRLTSKGFDCRFGELEQIDFYGLHFEVVLLRAVFYRTRDPSQTLDAVKSLLAPGGEIALIDPCPGVKGVEYYFRKQFPQGQFYILDKTKYLAKLRSNFNLVCKKSRLIYGRPKAPLKPLKHLGFLLGFYELLIANLLKRKSYVLSYTLQVM